MATTDTKPGFKLPWSSERSDTASPTDAAGSADAESTQPDQEIVTPEMIDSAPAPATEAVVEEATAGTTTTAPAAATAQTGPAPVVTPTAAAAPTPAPPAPAAPTRKPNKFMADLTRAMQVAAEAAREDTLTRFNADAKTFIEGIHTDSATEAADLRKGADDDIAGIRDWSKAEIARIREETDERIAHRKSTLEQEIEEHAAAIEARIERVQTRVTNFEEEMAAFFERLLAEDDPTRFAAMAESLPEPPPFDGPAPAKAAAPLTPPADAPAPEAPTTEVPTAEAVVETVTEDVAPPASTEGEAEPAAETVAEASAETASEPSWPTATEESATTEDAGLFGIGDDTATDPRLSALGLTPDFAAAEAEAASFSAEAEDPGEPIPEIGDDAIAARLAGLVPEGDAEPAAPGATTRVVVTGLISVASIAAFKRHLSRATGVQSVGVSSGPDGEFVFAVGHAADVALKDVIPTLPGFAARVTAEEEGQITVAARDPEAEA